MATGLTKSASSNQFPKLERFYNASTPKIDSSRDNTTGNSYMKSEAHVNLTSPNFTPSL